MHDTLEERKAEVWSAFQHGDLDEDEATRRLLEAEYSARCGEPLPGSLPQAHVQNPAPQLN